MVKICTIMVTICTIMKNVAFRTIGNDQSENEWLTMWIGATDITILKIITIWTIEMILTILSRSVHRLMWRCTTECDDVGTPWRIDQSKNLRVQRDHLGHKGRKGQSDTVKNWSPCSCWNNESLLFPFPPWYKSFFVWGVLYLEEEQGGGRPNKNLCRLWLGPCLSGERGRLKDLEKFLKSNDSCHVRTGPQSLEFRFKFTCLYKFQIIFEMFPKFLVFWLLPWLSSD